MSRADVHAIENGATEEAAAERWGPVEFDQLFVEVTCRPVGTAADSITAADLCADAARRCVPSQPVVDFTRRVLVAFVELLAYARSRGKHHGTPGIHEFVAPIGETQTTGFAKALDWLDGKRPSPPAANGRRPPAPSPMGEGSRSELQRRFEEGT